MLNWLTDLYNWITTLPTRALDLVLSPVADYIDTLQPLSSSPTQMFLGLSSDVLQLATLIGLPQAMGILGTAYAVRFVLQLIPFVRLGS